jgi:hypothetical protein
MTDYFKIQLLQSTKNYYQKYIDQLKEEIIELAKEDKDGKRNKKDLEI